MDRPAVQHAGRGESGVEGIVMELSHQRAGQPYGLLYPLMLISAIAVIVFSILGIASIAGWMPNALSAATRATQQASSGTTSYQAEPVAARASSTFDCAECRMLQGIRALETGAATKELRTAAEPGSRL
jgi:hypothetical protein